MNKKLLIFRGKDGENSRTVASEIKEWARENDIRFTETSTKSEVRQEARKGDEAEEEPIMLSLGGDGTFLRAADLIAPYAIPILGINLGKLGFLTGLDSSDLTQGLNRVFADGFSVKELTRLRCQLDPSPEKHDNPVYTALNEVVISRGDLAGLAEVKLFLNEKKVASYPGDGLIISTPTGSTAYSLSSGGPLITRDTSAFSITPLNVHKLGLRPIICGDETQIKVRTSTPVSIQMDGRDVGTLSKNKSIAIDKAPTPTLMIIPESRSNFFETVRNKLNWDKDRGTR